MATSRRNLIQAIAAGGAALATARGASGALAQEKQPGARPQPAVGAAPDFGEPSAQERELKVVSIERLEDEARKILSPGRFAIMGPCGDGWTYRENRRAFNDFPIMPRRLQSVDDKDIDLRTTLLGHTLADPGIHMSDRGPGQLPRQGRAAQCRRHRHGRLVVRRVWRVEPARWRKSPRRPLARSGSRSI